MTPVYSSYSSPAAGQTDKRYFATGAADRAGEKRDQSGERLLSRDEEMDQSEDRKDSYSEDDSQFKDTPEDLSMGGKDDGRPVRNSIEK